MLSTLSALALLQLLSPAQASGGELGCAPRFVDGRHAGCACTFDASDYGACREGDEARCDEIAGCRRDNHGEHDAVRAAVHGDHQSLLGQLQPQWTPAADRAGTAALLAASEVGRLDTVAFLLEAGVVPNCSNRLGQTPLSLAVGVYGARPELVKRLLDGGADPDFQPPRQQVPPLVSAVSANRLEVTKLLLEAGADPDVRSGHGRGTALMVAASRDRPRLVEILLEAGADPTIRGRDGSTALKIAQQKGADEVAAMLEDAIASRAVD